jgi:acid phosphatase (class A)
LPPPAIGSPEANAELVELQRLQKASAADEKRHARGDHDRTVARFLGEIGIDVRGLPEPAREFFHCIAEMSESAVADSKSKFNRTRPYKLPHNDLHPLKTITADDTASYPSGHATYGMLVGLVLVQMLPEKSEAIYKRIEDFGYSRLVSGVHYRSDVYAGEISGAALAATLFMNPNFRDQLNRVTPAIRKAAGLAR